MRLFWIKKSMTPRQFHDLAVVPGLSLLPPVMTSPEARVLLVAIPIVETGLLTRSQMNGGPAVSLYQFEEVGIDAVFANAETGQLVVAAAGALAIPVDATFYEAVRWNDLIGVVLARLTLWPDPAMLPALGQEKAAFDYYRRTWKPGLPSAARWTSSYAAAMACMKSIGA